MSGTPEKILEHLLEMMRLDSQFTESGSAQHPPLSRVTAAQTLLQQRERASSPPLSPLARCLSSLSSLC